jgi:hypothetical protein
MMPRETVDDHDLMTIRAETLFTYDARGRMVRNNEPEGDPAPRLFLGYTTDGYVLRLGQAVPDVLVRRLHEIVDRRPPVRALQTSPTLLAAVREVLEEHAPVTWEVSGPVYRFPESVTRSPDVVQVTEANVDVLRDAFPWLHDRLPAYEPCFAVLHDGAAVSVCFSSRIGAAACEAGAGTLPAFRGRGYAAAVTAAWGAAVRSAGQRPLYSTTWDNLASQGVARRRGLIMFGADVTLT